MGGSKIVSHGQYSRDSCPVSAVEFFVVVLPEGHKAVHIGNEALVVVSEQVNHFVDYGVL